MERAYHQLASRLQIPRHKAHFASMESEMEILNANRELQIMIKLRRDNLLKVKVAPNVRELQKQVLN